MRKIKKVNNFLVIKNLFNSSIKTNSDIIQEIFNDIKNEKNIHIKKIIKKIKRISKKESSLLKTPDEFGNTLLHYAAFYGLNTIVSLLINTGSYWNIKNHLGQTPIFNAVINNNYSTYLLLKEDLFINDSDNLGNTLLHYAVLFKNTEIVQNLINNHADQKIKNNEQTPPLKGVLNYDENKIKNLHIFLLYTSLIPYTFIDDDNNNLAHYCIINKNYPLLREILKYRNFKKLFFQKNKKNATPLCLTGLLGDEEAFNIIFKKNYYNIKDVDFDIRSIYKNLSDINILKILSHQDFKKDLYLHKKGYGEELLILAKNNKKESLNYILDNFVLSSNIEQSTYENILYYLIENKDKETFERFYILFNKIKYNSFFNILIGLLDNNHDKDEVYQDKVNFILRKQYIFLRREQNINTEENILSSLNFLDFLSNLNDESLYFNLIENLKDRGLSFKNLNKMEYIQTGCILHKLIKKNKGEMAKKLPLLGLNIDILDFYEETALEIAISKKNNDMVEFLTYRTRFLNDDNYVYKIIEQTILENNMFSFSHLLDIIKITRNPIYLDKIMNYCIINNKNEYFQKIVFKDGLMKIKNNSRRLDTKKIQFYLYLAIEKNNVSSMEILISRGADINKISEEFTKTPLQTSIINNSYEAFMCLLKNGADIKQKSLITNEETLDIAIKNNRTKMIKELRKKVEFPNYLSNLKNPLETIYIKTKNFCSN